MHILHVIQNIITTIKSSNICSINRRYQWAWGAADAGSLLYLGGLHFRGDGGDAVGEERGGGGGAGGDVAGEGLQYRPTPEIRVIQSIFIQCL